MFFFKRLFGIEKRAAIDVESGTIDSNAQGDNASAAALLSAIVGNSNINTDNAREIPALAGAIDFISATVAKLPVKLYRENASGKAHETIEITDDRRIFLLNSETGDTLGSYGTKKALVADMLLHGAGYMYVNQVGLNTESIHYVDHNCISVVKNSDPIFKRALIMVQGKTYQPWQFVIIARNSKDGVTGESCVKQMKTLLSTTYNALKYENTVSKTGGNKKGFLQSENALGKKQLDEVRRAWEELYANNGNNMMVLNNGLKYVASASTAVEMQLNQNKLTNSAQIDMALLLSPEVISGKATKEQFAMAVTTAVTPIVEVLQEALNRSMLLESEKKTMYFAVDVSELNKGDILSRYQAYRIALDSGFLQPDEVRYKEDLPALGFNYIKLDLSNVLFDPKTKTIYTPNTNQTAKMGEQVIGEPIKGLQSSDDSGIIEKRYSDDQPRDDHGRFASGGGSSVDSGAANPSDSNGQSYKHQTLHLPKKEYGKVMHSINTVYDRKYAGKSTGYITLAKTTYKFEIHEYNEYNIFDKFKDE